MCEITNILYLKDNPVITKIVQSSIAKYQPNWQLKLITINEDSQHKFDINHKNLIVVDCSKSAYSISSTIKSIRGSSGDIPILIIMDDDTFETTHTYCDEDILIDYISSNDFRRLIPIISRLRAVSNEIKRRKKAETEYLESEERFRLLVEQASDAFFLHDMEGKFIAVNQHACDSLGYSRKEFLAMRVANIELSSKSQDLLSQWEKLKPQSPVTTNGVHRRKDGSTFPVEVRVGLVSSQNQPFVLALARDVTTQQKSLQSLKESEEQYRTLFEESKDVVFVATLEGNFLDINSAGVELLGYDTKKELLQIKMNEKLYADTHDHEVIKMQLQNHGHVKDYEIELLKKNGHKVLVLETATPVYGAGKKIISYRGIIRDITERRKLEQHLLHSQKMDAIGTLASGIAHDFNNILLAIIGYTELAISLIADGHLSLAKLEHVLAAAARARDLVSKILTFSSNSPQERKPIDLSHVLKEALQLLRPSLPATIDVQVNIKANVGAVLADSTQLHQVIMNLGTNAYQAMKEQGGILRVDLDEVDLNPDLMAIYPELGKGVYVKLSISDTGPGIPKEQMKRIFDPFYTTKSSIGGTGLGLSVVHGIVRGHGGVITAYSEIGRGTKFQIYIPEVEVNILPGSHRLQVDRSQLEGVEHILLVDDEPEIVDSGTAMLKSFDYTVTATTNCLEAIELFQLNSDQIDLVITDYTMPEMTGIELAQELIRIRPNIPIILITGFGERISAESVALVGIREYVPKPFFDYEIISAIRRVLD